MPLFSLLLLSCSWCHLLRILPITNFRNTSQAEPLAFSTTVSFVFVDHFCCHLLCHFVSSCIFTLCFISDAQMCFVQGRVDNGTSEHSFSIKAQDLALHFEKECKCHDKVAEAQALPLYVKHTAATLSFTLFTVVFASHESASPYQRVYAEWRDFWNSLVWYQATWWLSTMAEATGFHLEFFKLPFFVLI